MSRTPAQSRLGWFKAEWDQMIVYEEFSTRTEGRLDALDITPEVEKVLANSGVRDGSALVFSPHTTCCVLVANGDRTLIQALGRAMEVLSPDDGYYHHDDFSIRTENLDPSVDYEPENAPAHLVHVFSGKASEVIPIRQGTLGLGDHQRIYFVELCSPRPRRYCVQVLGE